MVENGNSLTMMFVELLLVPCSDVHLPLKPSKAVESIADYHKEEEDRAGALV